MPTPSRKAEFCTRCGAVLEVKKTVTASGYDASTGKPLLECFIQKRCSRKPRGLAILYKSSVHDEFYYKDHTAMDIDYEHNS